MANWKHRCDIRQFVNDESLNDRQIVEKVAEEISKCSAFNDTLYAEYLTEILDLEPDELQQEADGYLAEIYDFADENLIWMGS